MWLFYPPVCLWIGWLSLRFGGLMTMTAANPGIEDGGTLGESKAAILSQLPHDAVIPFHLIDGSTLHQRLDQARKAIARSKWSFPIVMKPDVGERGTGVRLAHSLSDIEAYCATTSGAFLLQAYHPGPYEAGVFYYRFPGESRGQVLSITDKKFPLLVGDGRSTIEQLVWDHPRYRMQADVFLTRHAGQTQCVLHVGERFSLGMAGNHSKGTMFLDGEHLRTAALERRVDAIARQYPGFYIGRFDVRYSDVDAFKSGDDFAIVELNGATSEPTDLYDPRNSLWSAYRKLFTQWSLVFAIGAANRRRGAKVTSLARVTQLVRAHMARPAQGAD